MISYNNSTNILSTGLIIFIIFALLVIGTFIYSYKANQALQVGNIQQYNQDEKILENLNMALIILGVVSIIGFALGKSSTLVIPIPF